MSKKEFISKKEVEKIVQKFDMPYVLCEGYEIYTKEDIEKAKKKFCKKLHSILKRIMRRKKQ